MLIFDVSMLFVVRFSIETLMTLMFLHLWVKKREPFDQLRNVSLVIVYLNGLHGFCSAWLLGFPTMFLATGRRPLSMSRGGMWPECGSDCQDGGEGVTDQGAWSREERREGVCREGKWSFCLNCHLSYKCPS